MDEVKWPDTLHPLVAFGPGQRGRGRPASRANSETETGMNNLKVVPVAEVLQNIPSLLSLFSRRALLPSVQDSSRYGLLLLGFALKKSLQKKSSLRVSPPINDQSFVASQELNHAVFWLAALFPGDPAAR